MFNYKGLFKITPTKKKFYEQNRVKFQKKFCQ